MVMLKLDVPARRIGVRRHLTEDQRACLAEEVRRYLAEKNKVSRAALAREARAKSSDPDDVSGTDKDRSKESINIVKQQFQIPERKIREASKLDPQTFEAAECGEDVAELRCVTTSAVKEWRRSSEVIDAINGQVQLTALQHFQPTHAVEIARHFRKLRGKAEKWDEENLCRDYPKALDAIDRSCKRTPADNKPVDNVHEHLRPDGNTREAGLRRLRKDRPDLHAEVLEEKERVVLQKRSRVTM
jgi:hypothetical protein